jgi:hypothetical protein
MGRAIALQRIRCMSAAATESDPRPLPPQMPDAAECCGEGCVRCVFDVYDEAQERYQRQLSEWLARHPERSAPKPQD